MKTEWKRIAYALAGFVLGVYTLPLGLLLWPLGLAWFLANEADDGSDGLAEGDGADAPERPHGSSL